MAKSVEGEQYKGWLFKWTNYIKGYQKRWFVVHNGTLSYYRSQADSANACRGSINLANAFIHTQDSSSFVVSNAGSMTFHLKAGSEVERQRWVTKLEFSKSQAINKIENEVEEDEAMMKEPDKSELQTTLRVLEQKVGEIKMCGDLVVKHGAALQRALCELEQTSDANAVASMTKLVNERATMFKISSNAMINVSDEYQSLSTNHGQRWQKLLQYEHERRLYLEEMVEQLGKQHMVLERQIRKSIHGGAGGAAGNLKPESSLSNLCPTSILSVHTSIMDEDDDDFFDALDESLVDDKKTSDSSLHKRSDSAMSFDLIPGHLQIDKNAESSDTDYEKPGNNNASQKKKTKRHHVMSERRLSANMIPPVTSSSMVVAVPGAMSPSSNKRTGARRTRIPDKPNYSLNLWSIVKNCIGKDLSKIPMPINFNEPLSMIQRLTEDFEYSDILDTAAACTDSCLQMAYVAAFTISSYANTPLRTGKPFNPLLGETYECDRFNDLGWRSVGEQVSHHPPTVAMYMEGREWQSWQEFTMSSKFRGKYLQLIPLGISHLVFPKSGNHYTWRKVTTTVNNIIVGKLWVDNHGEMEILNHNTSDLCQLKYYAYSYFSSHAPRKVTGLIKDGASVARYELNGTWDNKMEGSPILNGSAAVTDKGSDKNTYKTGEPVLLWQRRKPPPELTRCYNFTQLAVELNEPEAGVAPTDSRNRPDQRLMEEGKWDEANEVKVKLEEKQRAARKQRDNEMEEAAKLGKEYIGYEPKWFKKTNDPQTDNLIHQYTGEYWQCKEKADWSRCPDIYL